MQVEYNSQTRTEKNNLLKSCGALLSNYDVQFIVNKQVIIEIQLITS